MSSFLPCAFRQNLDKDQNLDKQINSFYIEIKQRIPPKEFLQKQSSQKNPPKNPSKKILPKNSCKIFPPKNPSEKFQKIPKKSKQFPKIFQQFLKKLLKKFLRFWKYPIPYIALGGRKPFRACYIHASTFSHNSLSCFHWGFLS